MASSRHRWLSHLALLWVCLVGLTAGQAQDWLVESSFFNHTHATFHSTGDPSLALGSETFTVSFTINLNSSFMEPHTRLTLKLIPPYQDVVTTSGCKQYVSSYGCASSTTTQESFISMSKILETLDIWVSPGAFVEKSRNTSNAHSLEFDFGVVTVDNLEPEPTIVITFDTHLLQSTEDDSRDTSFTFNSELTVNQNGGTFTNTSDLMYVFVKPVLEVNYQIDKGVNDYLKAGTSASFTITVRHKDTSTATANGFLLSVSNIGTASAPYNNDMTYSLNGGADSPVSNLNDVLGGATTISNGNTVVLKFIRTAVALPYLDDSVGVVVHLTYRGSTSRDFSDSRGVAVSTPSVNLTADTSSDVNLGSELPAGGAVTISRTLTLPVGILQNFAFQAEFESQNLSPIPITFESSSMTYPPGSVTFADPTKINVGAGGFTNSLSRRKRSPLRLRRATSGLTSNVAIGDITNSGPNDATVKITVTGAVSDVSQGGTLNKADVFLQIGGSNIYLSSRSTVVSKPILTLTKTAEVADATSTPDIMRFNVSVAHDALSNGPAYDVKMYGGNDYFDIYWRDNLVGPSLSNLAITGSKFVWSENSLATNGLMEISYKADAATNQLDIPQGTSWLNATVTYTSGTGGSTYSTTNGCCITRVDVTSSSLLVNHGFTIMALIFGVILGLLIILLVMFLIIKVCKKFPFSCCHKISCCQMGNSSELEEKSNQLAAGGGLVTNTKAAVQKSYYSAKDVVKSLSSSFNESIVSVLRVSDKFKVNRELDNRDIQSTIFVDTQIEEERNEAMVTATTHLLKGLQTNGDISSDVMDRAVKKFKKGMADLDKNTENSFRNELGAIYDRLSSKNKEKLADLLARQQEEEEDMQDKTKDLSPKERDELLKLMRDRHNAEKNDLTYRLRLEQDEESEKVRKEYAIRKRMGIKELQQDALDGVKTDGKLTEQQADWLMKEYLKNQAAVEKLYDDEISRQRMSLEEKLARRRALAAQAEAQEEHQTEMLNTLATQQMQAINKMKKEKVLSPDEAQALIDQAHDEMMAVKKRMDMDRNAQEDDLQRKLSERKRKRMEELAKKQDQESNELEKKHKSMQTDTYIDPVTLLEEGQSMKANHRNEMTAIENEIDREHAEELLKLREQIADETKKELEDSKTKLHGKMKSEGMSDDQVNKLISKHKNDMAKLEETQQEERERQQEEFKKTLAKRKKEWASRREEEKKEQEQLREHEDQVVRKLMDNQLAISEDERERIMQEHEKQMVKLENSLTLNKLQQKRMLEERLAKKRSQQLEKLQKKQQQETKKVTKQLDNDSDIDDDERHDQELNLMKKHAEQRVAILQGEKIQLDDEMEGVREEMLKERASALQEQEVKLGAMLAALQMEKAKEMARIEEQQKAIHDLKANLMDDLNDKGILTDPKCQQVIEMHQRDQEKLMTTLDAQRAKQEKKFQSLLQKRLIEKEEMLQQEQENELNETNFDDDKALRRRLQERLAQKEANLTNMQEQQLKDQGAAGNTPAARIRRVALKHKHVMEMEQFRNRMEKEISQTLEDVRRQNDIRRIKEQQNQELQFINGLVRLGSIKMDELEGVMDMLFPLKTPEEKKKMMDVLTEGYDPSKSRSDPDRDEVDGGQNDGTLLERVKSARFERAMSARASARGTRDNKKPPQGKKKKKGLGSRLSNDKPKSRMSRRPEPLGRSNSPDYYSGDERLPPRNSSAKRTRRRKSVSYDDDYYEY